MDLAEASSRSFVVRIWIEETTAESGRVTWRGHVTDVFRDERRHVASLTEITDIIAPCLTQMGVRFSGVWRLGYWLRQRRARSFRHKPPGHSRVDADPDGLASASMVGPSSTPPEQAA